MMSLSRTLVAGAALGLSVLSVSTLAETGVGTGSDAGSNMAKKHWPSDISQYRFHLYPDLSQVGQDMATLGELLEEAPTAAGLARQAELDSGKFHNYPAYKIEPPVETYPRIGPDWTPTQERGYNPE